VTIKYAYNAKQNVDPVLRASWNIFTDAYHEVLGLVYTSSANAKKPYLSYWFFGNMAQLSLNIWHSTKCDVVIFSFRFYGDF